MLDEVGEDTGGRPGESSEAVYQDSASTRDHGLDVRDTDKQMSADEYMYEYISVLNLLRC